VTYENIPTKYTIFDSILLMVLVSSALFISVQMEEILRLDLKVFMGKGCWNPWVPKILDRDCGQSYSWETASLFKVHIDREPSSGVRMAMIDVSKYHIKDE
jgi:hypothetical protein